MTWTLVVSGQTSTVSFWTNPPYWVDFFTNAANGNTPPVIKFATDGPMLTGPPLGFAQTLSATVGQPLPLKLWASDAPELRKGAEAELAAIRASGNRNAPPPVAVVGGQIIGGAGAGRGGRGNTKPPEITVTWKKHRGPGAVTFAQNPIPVHTNDDKSGSSKRPRPRRSPRQVSMSCGRRSTTSQATGAVVISAAGRPLT